MPERRAARRHTFRPCLMSFFVVLGFGVASLIVKVQYDVDNAIVIEPPSLGGASLRDPEAVLDTTAYRARGRCNSFVKIKFHSESPLLPPLKPPFDATSTPHYHRKQHCSHRPAIYLFMHFKGYTFSFQGSPTIDTIFSRLSLSPHSYLQSATFSVAFSTNIHAFSCRRNPSTNAIH